MKINYNMKYPILLVILALSTLVGCQSGDDASKHQDMSQYEISNVEGMKHQSAVLKSKDNEILEKGSILNGLKDGQWLFFNTKGDYVHRVENYVNGKLHGSAFEINDRNEVTKREEFVNGQRNGYYAEYNRARKTMEAYYVNGQLHGRMTKYHNYSDKILSEADYKNGKQHGIFKYYDPEGNVTLEYEYENGKKLRGGMVDQK